MHCPVCASSNLSILRSIAHAPLATWPRERRCLDCDTTFETVEKITALRVRAKQGDLARLVPIDEFRAARGEAESTR